MNIKEYLNKKGFDYRLIGNNYQMNCPFCTDTRGRLGINKNTGQWQCLNGGCEMKGRTIKTFQKHLKDEKIQKIDLEKQEEKKEKVKIDQSCSQKFHKLLKKKNREALDYLMKYRGFSRNTINHFELGSKKVKGYEYVSIPYWESGKLVNLKFRAIRYKDKRWKWRRVTGGKSSLFHDDVIDDKQYKKIFICEAELDCIALYNAGYENVISVTCGAKSFKPEWYDRLERFEKIYLVYDNDVDGQTGARKMAERLGLNRCYNIKLPKGIKDVNEYFWNSEKQKRTGKTKKDFNKLVKHSMRFEALDCIRAKDAIKELAIDHETADEDELVGFDSPWRRLNKIIKGVRPGYLVVVSAFPKIGKTTFMLDWARYVSRSGVPSYFYECEMQPKRLGEKLVHMENKEFSINEQEITKSHLSNAYFATPDTLYFGYPRLNEDAYKSETENKYDLDLDVICDRIENAVRRYGIKVVVFDHLHFLVRGHDVSNEIGRVTRRFKMMAESLKIAFFLVVQPRKQKGAKKIETEDFKDSASIFQDCDLAILLHRDRESESALEDEKGGHYDPITIVNVAGRWCSGGMMSLSFDGNRSLFYERGDIYDREIKEYKRKKKKSRRAQ